MKADEPRFAAGNAALARSGWSPPVLRLASLLNIPRDGEIQAVLARIYMAAPALQGSALIAELQPLVVQVARRGLEAVTEAVGAEGEDWLRFVASTCAEAKLEGRLASVYRLDRLWGGLPFMLFDATRETRLVWPDPGRGRCLALRGRIVVEGMPVPSCSPVEAHPGMELRLGAGAQMLIRSFPLTPLLEAAQAAGVESAEICAELLGKSGNIAVVTAAGRLQLSEREPRVRLNGRRVELSPRAAEALSLLARTPGHAASRASLTEALELGDQRQLDRVMMELRNGLGDGVVRTIYGSGYALEDGTQESAIR